MMGSSPVANPVCWGSIIAIPLNLTIPYDVTALIGEGGMGQAYQATDTKLNRQVALNGLVVEAKSAV